MTGAIQPVLRLSLRAAALPSERRARAAEQADRVSSPSGSEALHQNPTIWRQRQHPVYRSEEHTSELQSRGQLVCRLLLEKKTDECQQLYSRRLSGTGRTAAQE